MHTNSDKDIHGMHNASIVSITRVQVNPVTTGLDLIQRLTGQLSDKWASIKVL